MEDRRVWVSSKAHYCKARTYRISYSVGMFRMLSLWKGKQTKFPIALILCSSKVNEISQNKVKGEKFGIALPGNGAVFDSKRLKSSIILRKTESEASKLLAIPIFHADFSMKVGGYTVRKISFQVSSLLLEVLVDLGQATAFSHPLIFSMLSALLDC